MKLNELSDKPGSMKTRKRVGRGVKGQKARTGVAINGFEGGQMPLHRRLPKRGFTNISRKDYAEVSLERIAQAIEAGKLQTGQAIDGEALKAAGLVRRVKDGVRLLGGPAPTMALTFNVAGASAPAIAAVQQAGGTVNVISKQQPADATAQS